MNTEYTRIVLRQVTTAARVGLASWERERPQKLLVNVELYAESHDYLGFVNPASIIDYYPIYSFIQGWRSRPHTELIEDLLVGLLNVCFAPLEVSACRVSVVKTEVLEYAAAAGAEAFMTREEYDRSRHGQIVHAKTSTPE